MSDFSIADDGTITVVITEEEKAISDAWWEVHKDEPNVQEMLRIGEEIQATIKEMYALRKKRH